MSKRQINFRLPNDLIAALRLRSETERVNLTDLVSRLLEQGLQLQAESSVGESNHTAALAAHNCCGEIVGKFDRLLKQLNELSQVIAALENHTAALENRIAALESFPTHSLHSPKIGSTPQGTVKSIYPFPSKETNTLQRSL